MYSLLPEAEMPPVPGVIMGGFVPEITPGMPDPVCVGAGVGPVPGVGCGVG